MGPRHRNSAKSEGVVRGFSAGSASHDAKEPHSDGVQRLGNMFSFTLHRHQQLMKSEETIMIKVKINGQARTWDGDPELPLLWFMRHVIGLTVRKFRFGHALCRACAAIVSK